MPSLLSLMPIGTSPRQIITRCGGFYECPRDGAGRRIGPLVGYAGRDKNGRQFVGDVFVNFATVEQWPHLVARHIVPELARPLLKRFRAEDFVLCGAPEGGKSLATLLGLDLNQRYVFPDKIVTKVATPESREVSHFEMGRHVIERGDQVVIIEDVCNNFSSTSMLRHEIERHGGQVVAIVCFLNRSPEYRKAYENIPIIACWNEAMPEYSQDDPEVASDIAAGNVVWKPKVEWERLMEATRTPA